MSGDVPRGAVGFAFSQRLSTAPSLQGARLHRTLTSCSFVGGEGPRAACEV